MVSLRFIKVLAIRLTVATLSIISLAVILLIHVSILVNGLRIALLNGFNLLTGTPPLPTESKPLGGVGPSLVGSLLTSGLAILISTPVSIILGFFLVEHRGSKFVGFVRAAFQSLYGLPTITISLIVYILLVIPMRTQSLLAGSISLLIVALPMELTYFENVFSNIPLTYKEAGYSIGLDRLGLLTRVVLGISKSGLASALTLTLARVMGETAPVLFTIGNALTSYPTSLFQPSSTITTLIFMLASSPFQVQFDFAWGAVLTLYLIYLFLFTASKLVRGVEL